MKVTTMLLYTVDPIDKKHGNRKTVYDEMNEEGLNISKTTFEFYIILIVTHEWHSQRPKVLKVCHHAMICYCFYHGGVHHSFAKHSLNFTLW